MINKNLSLLLSGQLISQVGDKFHMIALSFWVLETTGSPAKMGIVLAASLIPSLVMGFFSGAFIDRYPRKTIIVYTDIFRGAIIGVFALLFYLGTMNFHIILLMQILLSLNAAFFDPAIPSVIPMIVKDKDLASANSRHQFINGFSTIAGAFLGGILISRLGYLWIFVLNAISFILSAGCETFIHIPKVLAPNKGAGNAAGVFEDIIKGYQYIFSKQVIIVLLFIVALVHFFVGSIEVIMPVIAGVISQNGPETLGYFHAALGLGAVVCAGFLSSRNITGREGFLLFSSIFGIGVLYAGAWLFTGTGIDLMMLYLCMIFLFGCAMICAGICFKTLLQKNMDNRFSGRVFSVAGSLGNASIPLAMMFFGGLLEIYDYQDLLLISGLMLMPLSVVSFIIYKEKEHGRTGIVKHASTPED